MYWHMSRSSRTLSIDRAIALHKMIRLITAGTMNGGYLTFMGNEFGHPEWIDFPREGNGWSYHYARRQWSLADNPDLLYHDLRNFDRAMVHLIEQTKDFNALPLTQYWAHEEDQVLCFGRGDLLFFFNFHPTAAYTDYAIPVPEGNYTIALDTDAKDFGGYGLIDDQQVYATLSRGEGDATTSEIFVYLPPRIALALRRQ